MKKKNTVVLNSEVDDENEDENKLPPSNTELSKYLFKIFRKDCFCILNLVNSRLRNLRPREIINKKNPKNHRNQHQMKKIPFRH